MRRLFITLIFAQISNKAKPHLVSQLVYRLTFPVFIKSYDLQSRSYFETDSRTGRIRPYQRRDYDEVMQNRQTRETVLWVWFDSAFRFLSSILRLGASATALSFFWCFFFAFWKGMRPSNLIWHARFLLALISGGKTQGQNNLAGQVRLPPKWLGEK